MVHTERSPGGILVGVHVTPQHPWIKSMDTSMNIGEHDSGPFLLRHFHAVYIKYPDTAPLGDKVQLNFEQGKVFQGNVLQILGNQHTLLLGRPSSDIGIRFGTYLVTCLHVKQIPKGERSRSRAVEVTFCYRPNI